MRPIDPENSLEIAKHVQSTSSLNLRHGAIKILLLTHLDEVQVHQGQSWRTIWELVNEGGVNQIANPFADSGKILTVDGYEMPNAYSFINAQVPKYWTKHEPNLVVHVETNPASTKEDIVLQSTAGCCCYVAPDRCEDFPLACRPIQGQACSSQASTNLDLHSVANEINKANTGLRVVVSPDTIRSMGEYAYHKSLLRNPSRSVLVSLPPPAVLPLYSAKRGLSACIGEFLSQLPRGDIVT